MSLKITLTPMWRRLGFTAIELTAVASIIAILALILLPIVRSRMEQVRINAALDDMRSIEVGQVLANADTGFYFRLSDLDNPKADSETFKATGGAAPNVVRQAAVRSVPNGTWNRPFNISTEQATDTALGSIGATWNGPYIVYNRSKFIPLPLLVGAGPSPNYALPPEVSSKVRVYNLDTNQTVAGWGPILVFISLTNRLTGSYNDDFANQDNHPIDPWGAPYIFFGPGRIGREAVGDRTPRTARQAITGLPVPNAAINGNESNFGISAVYCLGPNGLAGNVPEQGNNSQGSISALYYRETGDPLVAPVLGTDDDLVRIF